MQLLHLPGSAENRGLMSLSAQAMTQLNQHIYLCGPVAGHRWGAASDRDALGLCSGRGACFAAVAGPLNRPVLRRVIDGLVALLMAAFEYKLLTG